tara:strand:- start:1662 stop:2063 length:402 start_codon:yes stop_codon:yes gene_type:complete
MKNHIHFNTTGQIGVQVISFTSICEFIGAWESGHMNQHGQWIESCLTNGLSFDEMFTMISNLRLNNKNDNQATHNINQIEQCLIILVQMSKRYKVCFVKSSDVREYNNYGSIPIGTPMIDVNMGYLTYTTEEE